MYMKQSREIKGTNTKIELFTRVETRELLDGMHYKYIVGLTKGDVVECFEYHDSRENYRLDKLPKSHDILYCLIMDYDSVENYGGTLESAEDLVVDLGYTDYKEVKNTARAIWDNHEKIKRVFTPTELELMIERVNAEC